MKLTVVGCSGSVPGPDSPASCYLVEADGFRVVLDLGNGSFGALQRYTNTHDLDAIVISHLHPDHCIDLTSMIVAHRWSSERLDHRVRVVGPSGTRDRIEAAYDPMSRKQKLHELFDFVTPADGELGPFTIRHAQMNHPVPTYATRLEHGGKSLVYSADTGQTGELIRLAHGADSLLCEASFGPDDRYIPDVHLTGAEAGEHASQAGVGRLIVTHVPPWDDPERNAAHAAGTYRGPIDVAAAGTVYEI